MYRINNSEIFGISLSVCSIFDWTVWDDGWPTRARTRLWTSKVPQRSDGLGQVVVELGHAGREEGVDHRARKEAAQVCLEKSHHLSSAWIPGNQFDTEAVRKGLGRAALPTVGDLTLRRGCRCSHRRGWPL